jgi:hypothetical protein
MGAGSAAGIDGLAALSAGLLPAGALLPAAPDDGAVGVEGAAPGCPMGMLVKPSPTLGTAAVLVPKGGLNGGSGWGPPLHAAIASSTSASAQRTARAGSTRHTFGSHSERCRPRVTLKTPLEELSGIQRSRPRSQPAFASIERNLRL